MRKFVQSLKSWLGIHSDAKFWIISVAAHACLLALVGSIVLGERYEPSSKTEFFFQASQEERPTAIKDESAPLAASKESAPQAPEVAAAEVEKSAQNNAGMVVENTITVTPEEMKAGKHFSFFGIQPAGQKIVFVVDLSGSMLDKEGELTRLDIAEREMNHAIQKLASSQYFNVVVFGDRIAKFSKNPVAPTAENKSRAVSFIQQDHNLGGSTNLTGAILAALEMSPDAVVVLTDGEANDPDDVILSQIHHVKTRYCPDTQIHAIGFFLKAKSHPDRFLARLTHDNGGQYLRWSKEAQLASILKPSSSNPR